MFLFSGETAVFPNAQTGQLSSSVLVRISMQVLENLILCLLLSEIFPITFSLLCLYYLPLLIPQVLSMRVLATKICVN